VGWDVCLFEVLFHATRDALSVQLWRPEAPWRDGDPPARPYFRPAVEGLEDRLVMASAGSMALPLNVTDINVVQRADGPALEAVVALAGQVSDTVTMELSTEAAPTGPSVAQDECAILNLELAPIHLNLLGLHVDTSAICLRVEGIDDTGLLGGLLCDLSDGLDLGGILGEIGGQLDTLLGQLDRLLDNVLGRAFTVTDVFGQGGGATAQQDEAFCDILNLELGPLDLNVPLLGVSVELDDCEGGPVTVGAYADPNGGLLGSLLCGLADGIDLGDVNPGQLVRRIDGLIDRLTDLADQLNDLDRIVPRIDRLIDRLENAVDRVDDLRDLDGFLDQVDRTLDRIDRVLR
jgi:hypothetical protein